MSDPNITGRDAQAASRARELEDHPLHIVVPLGREVEEFQGAVIDAAALRLLQVYITDGDGVEHAVPTALERRLTKVITETISAEARDAAAGVVEKVLAEGVEPRDRYGDRIPGRTDKVSVRSLIAEEMSAQLTRGRGHDRKALLDDIIREEVHSGLKAELKAAVDEAKAVVVDAVRASAAQTFAQAMASALPGLRDLQEGT